MSIPILIYRHVLKPVFDFFGAVARALSEAAEMRRAFYRTHRHTEE